MVIMETQPVIPTKTWSSQQTAIFKHMAKVRRNLVVRARAGTGKTTTIIEGISHIKKGKILLCAFNKKIAEELKKKLKNPNAEAKTLHSLGFGFVMKNWPGVRLDDERGERLAARAIGRNAPDQIIGLVTKLAAKGKNMLTKPDINKLIDIAYHFDLDPDERWDGTEWTVTRIAAAAATAMDLACQKDGTLDFDDMVYVPVANKWVVGRYDDVLIDEAQDMNAVQLALAMGLVKNDGRITVVGDDRQAIYGFRGADSNSIDRLKTALNAEELGLTTTYRCPKKVVSLAQNIVGDYKAAPSAPEGEVTSVDIERLHEQVKMGDFVLSRKNAPLAKVCLKLLKNGVRARIEGKDVGTNLISLIRKLNAKTIPDFVQKLQRWEEREVARLQKSGKKSAESKIENVHDKAETLMSLSEGCADVADLAAFISSLFADTPGGKGDYVICSSVHKSKGLESDNVFVLSETLYPRGNRGDVEEQNIEYVAITRAKKRLVWVHGIN